jgi:aminocarboxymuconate-semialdehyde decarboxylase
MNSKKIDGHRHILFSEAIAVASKLDPVRSVNIYPADIQAESEEINRKKGVGWNRKMHDFDENIADLEAAGMDMGVLQPTQTMFFYWAESPAAAELTRMVNEYTAQEVRKHATHFWGLATIPLQDVDLAVKELTYAVKELGLKGVVTGSNVNGHGFDEQQFLPFFEAVEALDVPIFIGPGCADFYPSE